MTGSNISEIFNRAKPHLLSLWRKPLFRAGLLVFATLLAYLPATHAGYIWDDDVYITDNPLLSAPDGLRRIWFTTDSPSQYFPLVYTTLRTEYAIWRLNPMGYHWDNIILHIINALLVWRLLSRLKVPGSWLAAMIFALHPVQVESVAWITERKNVLSVYFFLLTLLAWTEFIAPETQKKWRFYAAALACCALALFSKTTACTLPASLFLILWFQRMPITRRRILEIVPFGALGIGMGLLTVWWERYHQGTHGNLFALGLADRILIASHAVWFYLGKLFWPVDLTFNYPHWTLHPWNPLSYGWLLACLALCYAIYCAREDLGRGGEVAAVYYVATLSPMLGFIMLYTFRYTFVADHYQYAATIGPIALVSAGIVKLAESRKNIRKEIHAATTAMVLVLGLLTWKQCHIYRDLDTLWRDTFAKNPDSLMAHYNLANNLMREGRFHEALIDYNFAVEIDPSFSFARVDRAQVLAALGRMPEAKADYLEAMKLDPNSAITQNEFGIFLRRTGDLREAADHFQKAVDLGSGYLVYRKNLADTLVSLGDFAGALPHYQEIERALPDTPQSHLELAPVWIKLGKPDEALRECNEALRLDPQSVQALTMLAAAMGADGRFVDAVATCSTALDIAQRNGDKQMEAIIRSHIKLYQSGHTPIQPPAK